MTQGATAFIEPRLVEDLDTEAGDLQPKSAFAAIGGAKAVVAVVEEFYARLLGDPQTAPFFESLVQYDGMAALKRHQVLMLVEALGGPRRYAGRDLGDAHAGLGITDDAYRRVCLHLLTVLHDFKVPMDILVDVDLLLRRIHSSIVTASAAAPEETSRR